MSEPERIGRPGEVWATRYARGWTVYGFQSGVIRRDCTRAQAERELARYEQARTNHPSRRSAGVTPLYPNVQVQLTGLDGNAFSIIARVSRAMRGAGISAERVDAFQQEAMAGHYDALLATCMRWVNVL